jgi:hypothetical protein
MLCTEWRCSDNEDVGEYGAVVVVVVSTRVVSSETFVVVFSDSFFDIASQWLSRNQLLFTYPSKLCMSIIQYTY